MTNHNDAIMFESWSIVLYVGDSTNVRIPSIKKETCSNGKTSKINLNCYKHELSEVVA